MKSPRRVFLRWLWLASSLAVGLRGADAPSTAAGYWEGNVTVPGTELSIRVDLTRGGDQSWQGTIDIPLQGLRGFKLEPVKIEGRQVSLGLPGIPGEPRFNGTLAADGQSIAGEFSQGPGNFPFKLERKTRPPPTPREGDETPAKGLPGKGLAGRWQGSIKPLPNLELRLLLELVMSPSQKLEGVLISVDQGKGRIPITALTETNGAVHFEAQSVGGDFDGKLNADGSEIAGDWRQAGKSTPLVFKRLGPSAEGDKKAR